MSKTSQRKASAYSNGYQVGRYGWPPGVKCFRVPPSADADWRLGLRDGNRDRLAAERMATSWRVRLLAWLRRLVT